MKYKYIFRSISLSFVGLGAIGWVSLYFTSLNFLGPGEDSSLLQWYFDYLVQKRDIVESGQNWEDLAVGLYNLLYQMTIALLATTVAASLIWSIGSHFLNIDAPGKAKIYFIHWIVFTGIFMAIIVGIVFWFTKWSSGFNAADFLSVPGVGWISITSLVYYSLTYYLSVLLGTARFARSSVFLANKIPGHWNFL